MKKVLRVEYSLLREIDRYENIVKQRDSSVDWEKIHMSSCARIGYMMAEKRGVDPELAAIACAVHDYGRIITGKQEGHAEAGYLPVKDFLSGLGFLTDEEISQISLAVKNHSKKSEIGTPLEEIVKDADVLDFHQYGFELPREEQRIRLKTLLENGI